jgi:hypothetical protein
VISVAGDSCPFEPLGAIDFITGGVRNDPGSHFPKFFDNSLNSVTFLEPQFGGVTNQGFALGLKRSHCKNGKFVDHANDHITAYLNAL